MRIAATALLLSSFVALAMGRCTSSETLDTGPPRLVPGWAQQEGFARSKRGVAGARIFADAGCLTCHTYLGAGSRNVGAPDLSSIGSRSHRTEAGYAAYLADPSRFGNEVMPPFNKLGGRNLLLVGAFLRASKGPR